MIAEVPWYDICFCDYKGQCPHRASCRRSLTDKESAGLKGVLIAMSDFKVMREEGYRCFMKREREDMPDSGLMAVEKKENEEAK